MGHGSKLFGVNAAAAILSLLGTALSARILGAENFLVYALAASYATFETLLILGPLRVSAGRISAEADREQKRMVRGILVVGGLVAAGPIFGISALLGSNVINHWNLVLAATIAVVIATELCDLAAWQALVEERINRYIFMRAAPRTVAALCAVITFIMAPEERLRAYGLTALCLAGTLIVIVGPTSVSGARVKASLVRLLEYSWPNTIAGVFSWLYLLMPRMALEASPDALSAAGVILLLQVTGTGASIITSTLIQSFLPECQREFLRDPSGALKKTTTRIVAAVRFLLIGYVVAVVLVGLSSGIWERIGDALNVRLNVLHVLLVGTSIAIYSASQICRTTGDVAGKFSRYLFPTAIYSLFGIVGIGYYGVRSATAICVTLCTAELVQLAAVTVANQRINKRYVIT